jgi:hypothetical protein
MLDIKRPIHKGGSVAPRAMLLLLGSADIINIEQGIARSTYPSAAMTFSSIAIGVGNAVTSTVVRVGFGLPSPAKCSA